MLRFPRSTSLLVTMLAVSWYSWVASSDTALSLSPTHKTSINPTSSLGTAVGVQGRGCGGENHPGDVTRSPQHSVSLFGPEEEELERYSAALAGTLYLKQERDEVMKETMHPLAYLYLTMTKRGQHNRWMTSPWISEKARKAQKCYLMQAGDIIRSNGLTTARYNELSRILGRKKDLRDRVERQAHLYRVNADLQGDKIRPLLDLANTVAPRASKVQAENIRQKPRAPNETMLFVRSLKDIEALRLRHTRHLMDDLGCDELPPNFCRRPIGNISPILRKACTRFPIAAEQVVRDNGLDTADFNRLLAKTKRNLLYRWRIHRSLKRLSRRA